MIQQDPAGGKQSTKTFVLDTNVLLHNPNALFLFDDNRVIIPFTVIEEIDKFKKNNDDVGRNAREVIRHLDRLRHKGELSKGVKWNGHGGTVQIYLAEADHPPQLKEPSPDNQIISVAWHFYCKSDESENEKVIFISKDINCRIKSDALGIPTEDFEAQKVNADKLFKGYVEIETEGKLINQLYSENGLDIDDLYDDLVDEDPSTGEKSPIDLNHNQYLIVKERLNASHTGIARYHADQGRLIPAGKTAKHAYGILPRNVQQKLAMDLLMDDDIKLVTLMGAAGSGKTLLAVAAGLSKVVQEQAYERLLVARPIMPLGRDIGFLPGDKDQKLTQWMQPIFDNLQYILSTRGAGNQHADSKTTEHRINELLDDRTITLEPLTYIRGRSIPHQFMIVDEAQNLTPHEVKTIVSRVGEGTKLILTGDVAQIDNPYLDTSSNGLSFTVEKLKDSRLTGHMTLLKSERSDLASLAAEHL